MSVAIGAAEPIRLWNPSGPYQPVVVLSDIIKRLGMAFSRQKALGTVRVIQGPGPVTLWEVACRNTVHFLGTCCFQDIDVCGLAL